VKNLLQKIKFICEMEIAVCKDEPPETITDGTADLCRGRLEFAKSILKDIEKASLKPVYYNITIPISREDVDEVVLSGAVDRWRFVAQEDDNIYVRVKIVDESTFHAEDEEK